VVPTLRNKRAAVESTFLVMKKRRGITDERTLQLVVPRGGIERSKYGKGEDPRLVRSSGKSSHALDEWLRGHGKEERRGGPIKPTHRQTNEIDQQAEKGRK